MLGHQQVLDYSGKIMLAPMVRIGTLPTRLLALKYGADLVYSPEIIDRRLADSKRIENRIDQLSKRISKKCKMWKKLDELGTVDFVDSTGTLNLRVHPAERSRLILQMGTADPENALKAAAVVYQDVAGIDINCGCPKRFSVVSSMGSALLKEPERLESILETLVKNLPVPITCKIRMLPDTESQTYIERTVEFVQRMAKTGIAAIAIHCRFTFEKPREPGHWELFEHLINKVAIPLIANGDFYSLDDIAKFRAKVPKMTSFLIARGAQSNPSVFRKEGPLPIGDVIREYLDLAEKYHIHFSNAKYVLLQMEVPGQEGIDFKNRLCRTKNYPDLRTLIEDSFSPAAEASLANLKA